MTSELLPLPEFVRNIPGRDSQATHDLVFLASGLPPLGSKSFYVGSPENGTEFASPEINESISPDMTKDQLISNEVYLSNFCTRYSTNDLNIKLSPFSFIPPENRFQNRWKDRFDKIVEFK